MHRPELRAELERRAAHYLRQTHLVVDYYRIRRRLAFALPLRRLPLPTLDVSGLPRYPWATWLSWEVEERINALGWTGHLFRNKPARAAIKTDLAHLAGWPCLRQFPSFDLCGAHLARTLSVASSHWPWLGQKLRAQVLRALRRAVQEALPCIEDRFGSLAKDGQIPRGLLPHNLVHNIAVIFTVATAHAANVCSHPARARLNQVARVVLSSLLQARDGGHSEAVCYDGYILDFLADWLQSLPGEERSELLDRPGLGSFLSESYMLAAPGAMMQVAELHDVEPKQMPFHAGAQAKMFRSRPGATLAWYLNHCRVDWLRSDALAALQVSGESIAARAPAAGALDPHYAAVLRTGWETKDVAVVMGVSNSQASHVHCANGSLAVGTQRHWFITPPGYQQYMPTSEREFTIGAKAHNTPVVNGQAQRLKAGRRLSLEALGRDLWRTKIDLTGCYDRKLGLRSVTRTVWLAGRRFVVVVDNIVGHKLKSIEYFWHGHPDAAWWVENGWAQIQLANTTLWIHSPQSRIDGRNLQRLRGSRGQLTLCTKARPSSGVVWWIFAFGRKPRSALDHNGSRLVIEKRYRFDASA